MVQNLVANGCGHQPSIKGFDALVSSVEIKSRSQTVRMTKYGEPCWIRTSDLLIKSNEINLSYLRDTAANCAISVSESGSNPCLFRMLAYSLQITPTDIGHVVYRSKTVLKMSHV